MKKIGLLLCVVVLSLAMFACGNETFPEGDNFSAHQRKFYNDTISKVSELVDLCDDSLNLDYELSDDVELLLAVYKDDSISMMFSSMVSQDIISKEAADRLEEKCQYMLNFSIMDYSIESEDDEDIDRDDYNIGYVVICFADNASAKEFYNLSLEENDADENITLSKNKVMSASGKMNYDKSAVIDALNALKEDL